MFFTCSKERVAHYIRRLLFGLSITGFKNISNTYDFISDRLKLAGNIQDKPFFF